jgi:hypothetical protein
MEEHQLNYLLVALRLKRACCYCEQSLYLYFVENFLYWTGNRNVECLATNAGAKKLSFQTWLHFKEAFAPELVARAVAESSVKVTRCIDPFGGSGTTALACQFLRIHPTTIEVNPFLSDLIESKLTSYNSDRLAFDLGVVIRSAGKRTSCELRSWELPPTFIEPGVNGRWIFDRSVAEAIYRLLTAITSLKTTSHRRLFRALLGGILIGVSNVRINGKGRRYRGGWEERSVDPKNVLHLFIDAAHSAIIDNHKYNDKRHNDFTLIRGDSRQAISGAGKHQLAVFSPPYPNSFDYTDVYNVELWVLGYLDDPVSNRSLRESTLSSHVQINRTFAKPPTTSTSLKRTLRKLDKSRELLWNKRIPDMIGAYFSEMDDIIGKLGSNLENGGSIWMVIGNSQYADVQVDVSTIMQELAIARGFTVTLAEEFRSMRVSAQQGGSSGLAETLLVLKTKPKRK